MHLVYMVSKDSRKYRNQLLAFIKVWLDPQSLVVPLHSFAVVHHRIYRPYYMRLSANVILVSASCQNPD